MMEHANGERGEVDLRVAGIDLVIAAELDRLAALSTRLGCPTLQNLYNRLIGAEVAATISAVEILAVRGDAQTARAKMTLADFPACKTAFMAALMHHLRDSEGKAGAAGEGAAP